MAHKTAQKKTKSLRSSPIPIIYESTPLKAHPVLSGYFGYCLAKSMMKLKESLIREFKKFGIQPPQAGILDTLATSGPMNQLAIGEEMYIDKASMVKLIDSVEALGLVERKTDPNDRRAKTVEITAKGKKLLPKLNKARMKAEANYLSALTKAEAETYRRLTRKIFLSRFAKA